MLARSGHQRCHHGHSALRCHKSITGTSLFGLKRLLRVTARRVFASSASTLPNGIDLDWKPKLTQAQSVACMAAAGAVCALAFLTNSSPASRTWSLRYMLGLVALAAGTLFGLRAVFLERLHWLHAVAEGSLAGRDSR